MSANTGIQCRACREEVVFADAGVISQITYLYCKKCKIEVDDEGYEISKLTKPEDEEGATYLLFDNDDILDSSTNSDLYLTWDSSNCHLR